MHDATLCAETRLAASGLRRNGTKPILQLGEPGKGRSLLLERSLSGKRRPARPRSFDRTSDFCAENLGRLGSDG